MAAAYRTAYTANGSGGFVNISDPGIYNATSNTRGKLLESVPRYPYMTGDIVQDHWGVAPGGVNTYWWLDTNGTNTGNGLQTAYKLMKETYALSPINNVQPENFQRFVIFLGDGCDQDSTYSQYSNSTKGEFYAAALKAPTAATLEYTTNGTNTFTETGMNCELWTIGMGLDSTRSMSELYTYFPLMVHNLMGTVGDLWKSGSTYENFISTFASSGAQSPPWDTTADASYIEPHLITMAAPVSDPSKYDSDFPKVNFSLGGSPGVTTELQKIFQFYSTYGIDKANTIYEHASGGYPGATGGKNAVDIFREFAQRIVVGRNIKATDIIGQKFEIYSPAGVPSYELTGTLKVGSTTERWDPGTITISGRTISWNIPAIPNDGGTISLSYYVKLDPSADPSLYYNTNEEAYLEYDRKGIPGFNGEDENLYYHVKKYFPMPYASPNNGEKVEEGQGETSSPGSSIPVSTGKTGAEGHQENRDMAGSSGSDWAGVIRDVNPDVTAVKAGKDSSGRDKVYVDLSNGSYMRYQWQFKNAAGEWEDIFGANASHYTLGKQFTLNQLYELRCKITNPAGKITYTDSIEAKRSTEGNAGLQAKEDGPNIEGESLMDAGEEVAVANTATNGQILAILAGAAILALAIAGGVAIRRRVK